MQQISTRRKPSKRIKYDPKSFSKISHFSFAYPMEICQMPAWDNPYFVWETSSKWYIGYEIIVAIDQSQILLCFVPDVIADRTSLPVGKILFCLSQFLLNLA